MAIAKNRVSLELACSGSKVSFPGPCTYENGWTLPDEWTVRQLVGHGYLIYLGGVTTTSWFHVQVWPRLQEKPEG